MRYRERIAIILNGSIKTADVKQGARYQFEAERSIGKTYESAWRIPGGYSCLHVRRQLQAITASCGGAVELDDRGGVVIVRVFMEDLPDIIPLTEDLLEQGKVLLGYDRQPQKVFHSWKNPHMIIAAETGWGKTEAIRLIAYQLCRNHPPEELEIQIIDMKGGVSFLPFRSVPHITNIAYDLESAFYLLQEAKETMQTRVAEVRTAGTRRAFRQYRQRVIVIDEAAQLSPAMIRDRELRKVANVIDTYLASLASVGREIGFNLIYCTQYPHSDVINSQVKINCGARLCFHVPQKVNSYVVLDQEGAERLTVKGRGLYKTSGPPQVIQVPYLVPDPEEVDNDSAWEQLLLPLKMEVLQHGQSERKQDARIVIDAQYRSAVVNGSDQPSDVQRGGQPDKAGIRITLPAGGGKTDRGAAAGGYAQGVAPQQARKVGGRMLQAPGTIQYGEDSALVDDW